MKIHSSRQSQPVVEETSGSALSSSNCPEIAFRLDNRKVSHTTDTGQKPLNNLSVSKEKRAEKVESLKSVHLPVKGKSLFLPP